MRTIESKILSAIDRKKPLRVTRNGATHDEVFIGIRVIYVFLCHYAIAEIRENTITLSACGYLTNTTKSRLNAIARHFNLPTISQRDFTWYWSDGQLYNGTRTFERTTEGQNGETLNTRF